MKRAWGIAAVCVAALLVPATAQGHGHVPPPQHLEAGAHGMTRDYASRGMWWSRETCALLYIDPAPGVPRALRVPDGRRRIRIVYRTPRKPADVAVSVYGSGVKRHNRRVRLVARRDEAGEPVAWVVRFSAPVRRELRVFPFAGWDDQHGCGPEYVESAYRLRSK